ncbi:MAG: hypothetical protein K2X93_01450 [Candidatus Obscuribacterales bacterium]|nr:hypothetical protein [Candidatus Obscuribacterales bacterium]
MHAKDEIQQGQTSRKRRWILITLVGFVCAGLAFGCSLLLERYVDLNKARVFGQKIIVEDSSEPDALKVFFIGNSLLFTSCMPSQFAHVYSQRSKRSLKVWQVVFPGETLTGHLKTGDVQKIMRFYGPWDVVIIQDATVEVLKKPSSFVVAAKQLVTLARENGAKPYLFLPWARNCDCSQQTLISDTYNNLGRELETTVIPDGDLLFAGQRKFPDLHFFGNDNYHPSHLGSYFGALLTYYVLTGDMPEDVSRSVLNSNGRVVVATVDERSYSACMELLKMFSSENTAGAIR